jgi:hypothetical protein
MRLFFTSTIPQMISSTLNPPYVSIISFPAKLTHTPIASIHLTKMNFHIRHLGSVEAKHPAEAVAHLVAHYLDLQAVSEESNCKERSRTVGVSAATRTVGIATAEAVEFGMEIAGPG